MNEESAPECRRSALYLNDSTAGKWWVPRSVAKSADYFTVAAGRSDPKNVIFST